MYSLKPIHDVIRNIEVPKKVQPTILTVKF